MAEIELNAMARQCLKKRIVDIEVLKSELSAWEKTEITPTRKSNGSLRLIMPELS